jgi:hypothetical protein
MIFKFWKSFVLAGAVSAGAFCQTSNTMDLYAYPPVHKMNWSNPRSALLSLVASGVKKKLTQNSLNTYQSLVGHAMVHIRCVDTQGRDHDQWVGLTGQNKKEVDDRLVFDHQIGLGVLFYEYVDGSIDSAERSRFEITNYRGRLESPLRRIKPEFLRTHLNSEACERVIQMATDLRSISWDGQSSIEELENRKAGDVLHFGFTFDPYEDYLTWVKSGRATKMGGGCASMAVAFLKMAGNFFPQLAQRWTQEIDIGESRIGEVNAPQGGSPERVSIYSLLLGMGSAWKSQGESSRKLVFYDPELMWSYIHQTRLCIENPGRCRSEALDDIADLHAAGFEGQAREETFDHVKKYWLPARASKGSGRGELSLPVTYETRVTRKGLELQGL